MTAFCVVHRKHLPLNHRTTYVAIPRSGGTGLICTQETGAAGRSGSDPDGLAECEAAPPATPGWRVEHRSDPRPSGANERNVYRSTRTDCRRKGDRSRRWPPMVADDQREGAPLDSDDAGVGPDAEDLSSGGARLSRRPTRRIYNEPSGANRLAGSDAQSELVHSSMQLAGFIAGPAQPGRRFSHTGGSRRSPYEAARATAGRGRSGRKSATRGRWNGEVRPRKPSRRCAGAVHRVAEGVQLIMRTFRSNGRLHRRIRP